ncbi:MAG: ABC transporter permease subunit [Pseudomonadota bacterium]
MLSCADPSSLEGTAWLLCYLTTPKHQLFYWSFGTVLLLMALAAPLILFLGFLGALAKRSSFWALRLIGQGYTAMVRGVPDIVFFLFVPIAIDQGLEYTRYLVLCPAGSGPVYQGNDFVVCPAAKLPLNAAETWVHDLYGFTLALVAFAIVFGAFAANTLDGALRAVPRGQLETASAYGMSPRQIFWRVHLPQMWAYALPGLSNLWMILVKATPLLFLLGVEDIVYYARELGGMKSNAYTYPHPDWRIWYFTALLVFYLGLTLVSERVFAWLTALVSRGQASAAGAAAISGGRL